MQIDTHGPGPSGSGGINQPEVRKKPSKMKNPRNSAGKWAPSLAIVLIHPPHECFFLISLKLALSSASECRQTECQAAAAAAYTVETEELTGRQLPPWSSFKDLSQARHSVEIIIIISQ